MELAKNQEHTVTIEGYGEGGMGVATGASCSSTARCAARSAACSS